ncbi:pre-mRNA-splicing factor ATP-dependent RNA helicase DEAH7 [Artemisia annua]|uniref:Pre-mRNA-splicing factor ATP-dependent RNA helicase DEAH7 n=1 Tax=Artemisia annua TaxID=35608 RepID=A0A2U1QGP6_ARTAN|nr:pre-mRNA-splicing factor ATP-dependent RNA helicase DEAH7 [Artemisia annua]
MFYLTTLRVSNVFTDLKPIDPYVEGQNLPTEACSMKFVVGKFLVGKFLNFKMYDGKPVVKQVEELQIIVHELKVEGISINSNSIKPRPGTCYRLFTENAYKKEMLRQPHPRNPEGESWERTFASEVIKINNLLDFEFMDPPPKLNILNYIYQLWILGALNNTGESDQ